MTAPYSVSTVRSVTVAVEGRTLTTRELVAELAAGNPGALHALVSGIYQALLTERKPEEWLLAVWSSRLRGPDLWVAFQDECQGSPSAFVDLIEKLAAAGGAR